MSTQTEPATRSLASTVDWTFGVVAAFAVLAGAFGVDSTRRSVGLGVLGGAFAVLEERR